MALTTINRPDSQKALFGTGDDLEIYHNGTDSEIKGNTGSLTIKNANNLNLYTATNENAIVAIANGAVELYYNGTKKLETTSLGAKIIGDLWFDNPDNAGKDIQFDSSANKLKFDDDVKANFGSGDDLQLYHDGSDSWIRDAGTGRLLIDGSEVHIRKYGAAETMAKFIEDGAVELYHDNSKKLATSASGVEIENGDLRIHADAKILGDNRKLYFGAGNDLEIYHDGTNSFIKNSTGTLKIQGADVRIQNAAGDENGLYFDDNGQCSLYYDGGKKLETYSDGIKVYDDVWLPDDGVIRLGDRPEGGDLNIYHDGSNSRIKTAGTGALILNADSFNIKSTDNSENILITAVNGACELYYDNSKKFETQSDGVTITGNTYAWSIYDNTTSGGANVRVQSSGLLQRDTSSRRYKNTIKDAIHGLADLNKLRPVTYKGNKDGDTIFGGLIAEEVHDAGLTEFVDYDSDNRPDALQYGNMVSLCIKAIQELSAKVAALEAA